jgi:hypothetical protein
MNTSEKITALRQDRDALQKEAAELRNKAKQMESSGHRKSAIDRVLNQASEKERLAAQKEDNITELAKPSLF